MVERVSIRCAHGTRWRATPNAHQRKDQTIKISQKDDKERPPGWLNFTAVKRISFRALQTSLSLTPAWWSRALQNGRVRARGSGIRKSFHALTAKYAAIRMRAVLGTESFSAIVLSELVVP